MHTQIYHRKKDLIGDVVAPTDVVLDIGFFGQGVQRTEGHWPHKMLKDRAQEVYGLDLEFNEQEFPEPYYQKASAESFDFPLKFSIMFAGDLIEHITNPGLFLDACKRNLRPDGRLIITTPNAFNLFNIAGKLMHAEPVVNRDHTCYFNSKTLTVLLQKQGWEVERIAYIYDLGVDYPESWKKKFLNVLYAFFARFTPKFAETLVVIARPASQK